MKVCRYYVVRVVLALLLSVSFGLLDRAEALPSRQRPPRTHPALEAPAPKAQPTELVATDDTVFYLDGKRCRLTDVPPGAEVTLLDVARDGKTIIRIDFQTPKKE